MLRWWNHQVHLWLKFYVQERLVTPGQRPSFAVSMSTFLMSAFWHGFYPCYYLTFFFAAILAEVNKDLFKAKIIFRNIPPILQNILSNQCSLLAMNYMGIIFCGYTWHKVYMFMSSTHFYMFILLILMLTLTRGLNLVSYAKRLEAKI